MEIKKVAVIGAGLMGGGISQNIAQSGFETINIDIFAEQLDAAKKKSRKQLKKIGSKRKNDFKHCSRYSQEA